MPRKVAIKNLSTKQQLRISEALTVLKEVDFGKAIVDLVLGTDEFKLLLAGQIKAAFPNTGLSIIVGNTTTGFTTAGATTFLHVGGTTVFGHDGVEGFLRIGGTVKKFFGGAANAACLI